MTLDDCIYPDCLITVAGMRACEHSCPFERHVPRRRRCSGCGKHWADPPSDLCPGCEAYREHQA